MDTRVTDQPVEGTGEHAPSPEELLAHLPNPSVWPAVVAAGVTLVLFGVVTNVVFALLGLVTMAVGITAWVLELRHA